MKICSVKAEGYQLKRCSCRSRLERQWFAFWYTVMQIIILPRSVIPPGTATIADFFANLTCGGLNRNFCLTLSLEYTESDGIAENIVWRWDRVDRSRTTRDGLIIMSCTASPQRACGGGAWSPMLSVFSVWHFVVTRWPFLDGNARVRTRCAEDAYVRIQ